MILTGFLLYLPSVSKITVFSTIRGSVEREIAWIFINKAGYTSLHSHGNN
jgi:hypothetical protein